MSEATEATDSAEATAETDSADSTGSAEDTAPENTTEAPDSAEATEVAEAPDSTEATEVAKTPDSTEAEETGAAEPVEASDSTEAEETGAAEPVEATEATEVAEASDSTEAEETGAALPTQEAAETTDAVAPPDGAEATGAVQDTGETATGEVVGSEEDAPTPEVPAAKSSPDYKWYIIQTYSGYENRVKKTLTQKLKIDNLEELVEEIFVPGEDVTRVKNGKKRRTHVVYFPGYVLIKMKLTDELWHLLMGIPRVSGFVGGNNRDPLPLDEDDLTKIHTQIDEGITTATLGQEFDVGQMVTVIDGPFANFGGKVDEVNSEKKQVRVLISILGRSTPVELDFDKVKAQTD